MRVRFSIFVIFSLILISGCFKEHPDQPLINQSPKTFLWLFPDSTLAQGNSRQRIRWWGEDPDGIVKGYLLATGKFSVSGQLSDTLTWTWTTRNDSVIAFPLLIRQDTFTVAVRAVDNTLQNILLEQAVIRFIPSPYWDKNVNGIFDPEDQVLPTLLDAVDKQGSGLPLPLLNQPPSLVFAQNPNDPTVIMQQPETTYTSVAFSWVGSDPDGDQTIARYEIALNDSTDPTRWLIVPGNVKLISFVVPREKSDTASFEVEANVYTGTYATTRLLLGSISHLKLNSLNKFFIRVRDIAGDASPIISMPQSTGKWYVKKPKGKLLIVTDYILSDSSSALSFYQTLFAEVQGGEFIEHDILNISRGLNAQQKRDSKFGVLVSPFIDPAFISTLHLYDIVLWYTDQFPSLAVAQYPLYQYVRDASHRGKVIFSTSFESSSDPRGALKDFAPIDSVSSLSLSGGLLPRLGDTRIPVNFQLYSDSTEVGNIYPSLTFGGTTPPQANYSVFMRPIYRRPDAKYIYHIQDDSRIPKRYVYSPVLSDLKGVASVGTTVWVCGVNGVILNSNNGGQSWQHQKSGTTLVFNAIHFFDQNNGLVAGEDGVILRTNDGGSVWSDRSVITFEDLLGIDFSSETHGIIVGTNGLLIRTTNGGTSWNSPNSRTAKNIRSVDLYDANIGVAVGDSGLIIKTTNGGASWSLVPSITSRQLNTAKFVNSANVYAVGAAGTVLRSTDAGDTWLFYSNITSNELRSLFFLDENTGWVSGTNGLVYQTTDGGGSWVPQNSGMTFTTGGQAINDISFSNSTQGWGVSTGGVIIASNNSGVNWDTQPKLTLNVGVIDGAGVDGKRSFVFIGLPLHILNGDPLNAKMFLEKVILQEFGL